MVFVEGDEYRQLRRPGGDPAQFRSLVRGGIPPIPDKNDLLARYDFSQENGTLPVTDQTGNGNDLSTDAFSGVSADINGVQAGAFDGVDDLLTTQFATTQSQPNHIFSVLRVDVLQSFDTFYDGASGGSQQLFEGNNNFALFAGSGITGGPVDTTPHILSAFFNGSQSTLRKDGQQEVSGDVGSQRLDGFTIAGRGSATSQFTNMTVGEVLIYPSDKTSVQDDIETFLSAKWGVSI